MLSAKVMSLPSTDTLIEWFEAAALLSLIFYFVCWSGGRKLTSGQVFLIFAFGFAGFLVLNLLSSFVPLYVLLIGCSVPSVFRLVKSRFS